jgi:hypothetical protein
MEPQGEKKVYESNYLVGKNCLSGAAGSAFTDFFAKPMVGRLLDADRSLAQ